MQDNQPTKKRIKMRPYQSGFYRSQKRFPAIISAWGTGKTMFGILKGIKHNEKYPNSLGVIIRKEFTDLRDSTIKDFERYTGFTVGSNKEIKFDNGSTILFRHGKELEILQNMNLSWFIIEQAEEFETDEQFQLLRGRLRREGSPRWGAAIANAKGHNWLWRTWIKPNSKRDKEYEVFQATTFDNQKNLPQDFIDDLMKMKDESPANYNRFVMNSHEEVDLSDKVIPYSVVLDAVERKMQLLRTKRIISCDPAEFGDDETVIYAIENGRIIGQEVFKKKEPMETAGRCLRMKRQFRAQAIAIDPIGVGSGVGSRLRELGCQVILVDNRNKASDSKNHKNRRAEVWFHGLNEFVEGKVSIPDDDFLTEELTAVGYTINSKGQRQIDEKKKIKKADYLGRSPGRAECFLNGLWALKQLSFDDEVNLQDEDGIELERHQTDLAESYTVESVL